MGLAGRREQVIGWGTALAITGLVLWAIMALLGRGDAAQAQRVAQAGVVDASGVTPARTGEPAALYGRVELPERSGLKALTHTAGRSSEPKALTHTAARSSEPKALTHTAARSSEPKALTHTAARSSEPKALTHTAARSSEPKALTHTAPERGLAIYVKERYVSEYDSSTKKTRRYWKEIAHQTPVFLLAMDGRTVEIANSDYEIVKGTLHETPGDTTGAERLRGFAPGDPLVVVGEVDGTRVKAEALFAGTRAEYVAHLEDQAATFDRIATAGLAGGLGAGLLVALFAVSTRPDNPITR